MRELGRVLGRIQEPAILIDTSYLVNLAQHDLGSFSVTKKFGQDITDLLGEGVGGELIVFDTVQNEFKRLYTTESYGDFGIPKSSIITMDQFGIRDFPPELRDLFSDALQLWGDTSNKAKKTKTRGFKPSETDMGIIAYTIEQAKNGRLCFVLTYDEDIAGPVRQLSLEYPNIRGLEECLVNPDYLQMNGNRRILISPAVLGQLYSMETTKNPSHYALTTMVPLGDGQIQMIDSIHPIDGGIRFNEGDVRRSVILVSDRQVLLEAKIPYKKKMFLDQEEANEKRFYSHLTSDYSNWSILDFTKSRKDGYMAVKEIQAGIRIVGGKPEKMVEGADINWLKVDRNYLAKFSPQTLDFLVGFRAQYKK